MRGEDQFDRVVRSLHEAAFDATGWTAAAARIDALCGVTGDAIVFSGERPPHGVEVYLYEVCSHGQRREDLEQIYLNDYWQRDERVPRLRQLPDGLLVHVLELAKRGAAGAGSERRHDLGQRGGRRVEFGTGRSLDREALVIC